MEKSGDKKSGFGISGFVTGLLSLLFCWVPFLGFILSILGLIFSSIGMKYPKRGLAITGLVLSLISIIPSLVITAGTILIIIIGSNSNTYLIELQKQIFSAAA